MSQVRYVTKPWGQEEIWAHTPNYAGKILYINPNSKLSLQYHNQKEETIRVLKGTLYLHHQTPDSEALTITRMVEGDVYHVPVGRIHRFEAREEYVEIIEVSTSQLDDVVRLQDDYSRVI
jgi:mannose-6-phosphate isomerase-like protein (cupin superfamily)